MFANLNGKTVLACALLVGLLGGVPAYAQRRSKADIKIAEVKADALKTPDYKPSERSVKDHWGRFTVKFDVKKSGTKTEWIDELELTWKILVTTSEGKALLLSKTVTYEDVQEGSGHFACIYLKPKFLKRYMKSSRFNVANYSVYAEMRIDGQKIESYVQTKPRHAQLAKWYREDSNKERSDRYLIAKSQSPFAALDYDYYETEQVSE